MNVHTLYAVQIQTVESVDALIDQISNFSLDLGIEDFLVGADGSVDPTFLAVGSQAPVIAFTTSALKTALDVAAIGGLKISSDVDDDGVECWFQKATEGGVRAAGSNHIKMTVNEGMLIPKTLNAPHNEVATLEYDLVISYDGTNDPIVIAGSQALEGTASVGEIWTAGQVDINGSTLEGIQDITIDFGLEPWVVGADGTVWPTFVAIQNREPSITLTTTEVAALSTFGITGAPQGATDSLVYLRKVSEGATRVADNVAEHIKFGVDEGMIRVLNTDGAHNEMQLATVEIKPTFDGSNAIIALDTASVIS